MELEDEHTIIQKFRRPAGAQNFLWSVPGVSLADSLYPRLISLSPPGCTVNEMCSVNTSRRIKVWPRLLADAPLAFADELDEVLHFRNQRQLLLDLYQGVRNREPFAE